MSEKRSICKVYKELILFNAIYIKIPMALLTEGEETFLKLVWNHKRPQTAKANLRRNKAGGITLQFQTIL